jgi:hypothetical protein
MNFGLGADEDGDVWILRLEGRVDYGLWWFYWIWFEVGDYTLKFILIENDFYYSK